MKHSIKFSKGSINNRSFTNLVEGFISDNKQIVTVISSLRYDDDKNHLTHGCISLTREEAIEVEKYLKAFINGYPCRNRVSQW